MPARLRPTAPTAADAILVGDPGRALLLAQELLEKPKMSNHARGLWGYTGSTAAGDALTIQATGMGGPSAAIVFADLAKLGVKRVVRVGTCAGFGADAQFGSLLLAGEAIATGGSAAAFGLEVGESVRPDAELLGRLSEELEARQVAVASLDTMPGAAGAPARAVAADMQTVAVLARARELGIAAAAVLIVAESEPDGPIADEAMAQAATLAGRAASRAMSKLQVEG